MTRAVYVDLDDTLAETSRMFLSLLRRHWLREVEYCQLTSFSLAESLRLSPDELQHFVELSTTRQELVRILPVPGAKRVLTNWRSRGVCISIVTGRPPECHDVSCEWLNANGIPFDRLVIADKYRRHAASGVPPISLEELARMPFSLIIEDSLEVATYLAERTTADVVLRNCPWNMQAVDHPKIRRCSSWGEISKVTDIAL